MLKSQIMLSIQPDANSDMDKSNSISDGKPNSIKTEIMKSFSTETEFVKIMLRINLKEQVTP